MIGRAVVSVSKDGRQVQYRGRQLVNCVSILKSWKVRWGIRTASWPGRSGAVNGELVDFMGSLYGKAWDILVVVPGSVANGRMAACTGKCRRGALTFLHLGNARADELVRNNGIASNQWKFIRIILSGTCFV